MKTNGKIGTVDSVRENHRQFKLWRDSVVRLAKWDRHKNELEAAKRRVVARALKEGA